MSADEITIKIKLQSEEEFLITISSQAKGLELKEKCVEKSQLQALDQRLIFKGKILKDDLTLAEQKIENGVTIHLVQSSASKGTT